MIPVHNEEENLHELHRRLARSLAANPKISQYEMVFVDDASTDRSTDVLEQLSNADSRCVVYRHGSCQGQTGALKTGFDRSRYEFCVTMDADLQVYPEDVEKLLDPIPDFDIVNGVRRSRQDAWITVISSVCYNLLVRLCLASPSRDSSSNFTAFRTRYLKGLPLQGNDHRYLLPIVMLRGGKRVRDVAVHHTKREHGTSKYSRYKAWSGFLDFLQFLGRFRTGAYRPRTV